MKTIVASLFVIISLVGLPASVPAQDNSFPVKLESVIALYRTEGPEAALPEFQQLNSKYIESGNQRLEAITTRYIGESYWRLGQFKEARTQLEKALAMKRASDDQGEVANTLNVLGLLEWDVGNFDSAMANFRQAGEIGSALGDRELEGMSLNNLSLVLDELGDYKTALLQYKKVLKLYSTIDFPRGTGDTLGNIGGTHLLLGHYHEALGYYQQALLISEQLESVVSMSQDHGNIALSYLGLGEVDQAIKHFDVAVELARKSGLRQDEAYWMGSKGSALVQKGWYDLGLENHRASLEIYEQVGAQGELLEAMYELGQLLSLLGDPAAAEVYFNKAISLARQIRQSRGITANLMALGDLQYKREHLEEAATLYAEARDRSRQTGQQSSLASSLLKLAVVFRDQLRSPEAIRCAKQARHIAEDIDAKPLEAEAVYLLADLDREMGHLEASLNGFSDAEALLGNSGSPELSWQIKFGLAQTLEAMGDLKAAVGSLTEAVEVIESVRNRLHENRYRTGYLQDKYKVYVELVRLQLKLGEEEQAFSTAERLRTRNLVSLTHRSTRSSLTKDQQKTESELRERIRQLQRHLDSEQMRERPEKRQVAIDNFSQELLLTEQAYQSFLDDHVIFKAHQSGNPQQKGSIDVRKRLVRGDVLIEYIVGESGVMIFVLTPDAMHTIASPLPQASLNSRIALLRDLAQRKSEERWQIPARSLSNVLLKPLETAGWLSGAKRLYLVPHDVLNYLPFALLPTPSSGLENHDQQLLLDSFQLVHLPTAFALDTVKTAAAHHESMLVMAPSISRLQFAPEEARSINAIFSPSSHLLTGKDATESRFKELAAGFGILHFATHGYFNKYNPVLSGLELEADSANDGLLEVHEILELELSTDLVTLSACQTALGSGYLADIPAGDDFVSLTRAFLSAGSHSVLATLWGVDDRSTIHLMLRFYRTMTAQEHAYNPAIALANAQRDLRATPGFQHPYYWAPFVLVRDSAGNPKGQNQATGEVL